MAMVPIDVASRILASAFHPLCCVTESADRGRRLRVLVYDHPDGEDIHDSEYKVELIRNPRRLAALIYSIRDHLEEKAVRLHQWQFSTA